MYNSIYKSEIEKIPGKFILCMKYYYFFNLLTIHFFIQGVKWLNFQNELLDESSGILKKEFHLDGTHVNPRYVYLIENSY